MQNFFDEIENNLEIKPYNIDAAGHVNNAVYMNWLEDARLKLFDKILPLDVLIDKGYYLVVASTSIDFKKPLHLFDKPNASMKVSKYGRGIWYLSAEIKTGSIINAKAAQKCVIINKSSGEMVKTNSEIERLQNSQLTI